MNIKKIREREEKATGGPWSVGYDDGSGVIDEGSGACIVDDDGNGEPVVTGVDHDGCAAGVLEQDDADFIAHARQDIPDLLDALEKATGFGGHTKDCASEQLHLMRSAGEGKVKPAPCDCGWEAFLTTHGASHE